MLSEKMKTPSPGEVSKLSESSRNTMLTKLRKEKNKTLKEMEEETGISDTTISSYERGETNPNKKNLKKLAEYFNVTVDSLTRDLKPRPARPTRVPRSSESICQSCVHLYGGSICDGKKPIPGWVAEIRVIGHHKEPNDEMYNVSYCPHYESGRVHPEANRRYLAIRNY
jgi:DNA-binding XRE family transcriptional regulator